MGFLLAVSHAAFAVQAHAGSLAAGVRQIVLPRRSARGQRHRHDPAPADTGPSGRQKDNTDGISQMEEQ